MADGVKTKISVIYVNCANCVIELFIDSRDDFSHNGDCSCVGEKKSFLVMALLSVVVKDVSTVSQT